MGQKPEARAEKNHVTIHFLFLFPKMRNNLHIAEPEVGRRQLKAPYLFAI